MEVKKSLKDKFNKLKNILLKMQRVLIAYSGGVDSTLLLKVAHDLLRDAVLAVTAKSQTYPESELVAAKRITRKLKIRHLVISADELKDSRFIKNNPMRCYYCKKALFLKIKDIAKNNKIRHILDGSNADDKNDFRPGKRALKEFKICSPLKQAGLSKDDIRNLSKKLNLPTFDKPALACLASRIPYGIKIKPQLLLRVDKAEMILKKMGFKQVRLRHYDDLCRIEVLKRNIPRLINLSNQVVKRLKQLGYNYITIDLEGYRSGSMNEAILKVLKK